VDGIRAHMPGAPYLGAVVVVCRRAQEFSVGGVVVAVLSDVPMSLQPLLVSLVVIRDPAF
jgi:hypothetical protein